MRMLSLLAEKPLRWGELASRAEREIGISEATLSRYLRNALEQGLVRKEVDEEGRVRYYLTAKGHYLVQNAEEL